MGGQRHYSQLVLEARKAHAAGMAGLLVISDDTGLPVQLRGTKDWGLQLIVFLIGGNEEVGPNYPSKCLMFYEAFTALYILTVFYCYFTVSSKRLMQIIAAA